MRGIVCGFGQVGYRICMLALQCEYEVTVVTSAARPEWQREAAAAGAKFVIGDARDEHFLVAAGLDEADWLMSATANDLVNIEVVLDAKRLRHDVCAVARVFDQTLAPRLESTFGIDRVLAMSRLAAPTFTSAAFGDQLVASFEWLGERHAVVQVVLTDESQFVGSALGEYEGAYGLSTLLLVGSDGSPILAPGPEIILRAGDMVKFVGQEWKMRDLGSLPRGPEYYGGPTSAGGSRLRNPRRRRLHIWRNAPSELKALLLALVGLILMSTIVFRLGMRLRLIDAFYFVISTVTTTGYGDVSAKDSPDWVKLFASLVMVLGSATVATLYSIITNALVSARLREIRSEHPIPEKGHVIVVGVGNVGFRTCEELLRLGVETVAIDATEEGKFVATLKSQMPVIVGDARESEVLDRANLSTASAIIVTTSDDAVNLSVGLIARETPGARRIVLRLFDAGFAKKVQSTVAFDGAFSAPGMAAPTFVGSAAHPASVASFVVHGLFVTIFARRLGDGRLESEQVILGKASGDALTMVATKLKDLGDFSLPGS